MSKNYVDIYIEEGMDTHLRKGKDLKLQESSDNSNYIDLICTDENIVVGKMNSCYLNTNRLYKLNCSVFEVSGTHLILQISEIEGIPKKEFILQGKQITKDEFISIFNLNNKSDTFIDNLINQMVRNGSMDLVPLYFDNTSRLTREEILQKYNLKGQNEKLVDTFLSGFECNVKPKNQITSSHTQPNNTRINSSNDMMTMDESTKNTSNLSIGLNFNNDLAEALISFTTKIYGVTIGNRQTYVSRLRQGQKLSLRHENNNPYDKNAIAIYDGNNQLGYLPKTVASFLSVAMDEGVNYKCVVDMVVGGGSKNYGARITVSRLLENEVTKTYNYDDYEDGDYETGDFYDGMDEDERQGWDDWSEYVNDH